MVLKKACPDLMRFLVTTMMLYLGFMFCGWAVLGPYHIKVSGSTSGFMVCGWAVLGHYHIKVSGSISGFMFCGWAVLGPYHIKVSGSISGLKENLKQSKVHRRHKIYVTCFVLCLIEVNFFSFAI